MSVKTADLLNGRDNNFNLIRFAAATLVIYSHCFSVSVANDHPWFSTGILTSDFGYIAVNIFFILSGFLVLKSWQTKTDFFLFTVARILRIVPAIIVLSIITAFFIGPIFTSKSLTDYFTDPASWLYVPLTLTFLFDTAALPGMFETVLEKGRINVPLWTLKYEILSYAALAILGAMSLFATRTRSLATLTIMAFVYLVIEFVFDWRDQLPMIDNAMRFWFCFFLGAAFYVLRDRIEMSAPIGMILAASAAISHNTVLFEIIGNVALAYGIFWLALVPTGMVRKFNRFGDYSYGLYIFAWPLQQIVVQLWPELTPHLVFTLVFPIVLFLAALSWHFVEKPCLSLRKVIAFRSERLIYGVLRT